MEKTRSKPSSSKRSTSGGAAGANASKATNANAADKQSAASTATAKTQSTRPQVDTSNVPSAARRSVSDDANRAPRTLPETLLDERDDVLSVINELEDQLDRYEETREGLQRELNQATEDLQNSKQRNQELEWQVVTLQTRVDALEQVRQEMSLLEEEVNDANARAQRLGEQVSHAEKENSQLRNELKSAGKELEELWVVRKERDNLRVDIKNEKIKVEKIERQQKEYIDERDAAIAKFNESQKAIEDLRTGKNQLEMQVRAAEDRNQEMIRIQEAIEEKVESLRQEKKALQVQLTRLERDNARLVEQQQYYECELNSMRNQNRNTEQALANVKKAFAEVRVALSETKARARRRTTDASWPRTGTTLRGIAPTDGEVDADIQDTVNAAISEAEIDTSDAEQAVSAAVRHVDAVAGDDADTGDIEESAR